MEKKSHILVVDDDERLRDLLKRYLEKNFFTVSLAHDAFEAEELCAYIAFDAIVMDVMMPNKSGFACAKSLREKAIETPLLFLTAKGETHERVEGFESGGDDYLVKPFEPKELYFRLMSLLKRRGATHNDNNGTIVFGDYTYMIEKRVLTFGDDVISLSNVEAGLLDIFAARPGVVISRQDLADSTNQNPDGRTIDVQITRLRKKIEKDPKNPLYLQTIRGQGYVLRPDYND